MRKNEKKMQKRPDLSAMAEKWPSAYVERQQVYPFSGGAVASGTMANHDSKGTGVIGMVRIGRKIIYPVSELIKWLEDRAEKTVLPHGKIGQTGKKNRRDIK